LKIDAENRCNSKYYEIVAISPCDNLPIHYALMDLIVLSAGRTPKAYGYF
jgi:hypothetical protein